MQSMLAFNVTHRNEGQRWEVKNKNEALLFRFHSSIINFADELNDFFLLMKKLWGFFHKLSVND